MASFDPSQPGAIRLRAMARELSAASVPVLVDVRRHVGLPEDDLYLEPGERATVPAGVVAMLVEDGCVVRVAPGSTESG